MKHIEEVAVVVIVNSNGEVLVTQRDDPSTPIIHLKWQLPGGGKEKNETLEETCIREAKEETGLTVKLVTKTPHKITQELPRRNLLLCGFKAIPTSGTINTELDKETRDAKWLSRDEINKLDLLPKTIEMIDACY